MPAGEGHPQAERGIQVFAFSLQSGASLEAEVALRTLQGSHLPGLNRPHSFSTCQGWQF